LQSIEVISFDGNAQRDECKVDNAATGVIGRARSRAADFEMCEINEARQPTDEGWDICCGMEKRRVLVSQEFCYILVVVLCLAGAGFCLRSIREIQFFARFWMDQRWKSGLRCMGDIEGQVLHVVTQAIECSQSGWSSESARFERDAQILEQSWRSPRAEIVTDET
jgi:hypothetical protein